MKLVIESIDPKYDENFACWLGAIIKVYALDTLSDRSLHRDLELEEQWNEYFKKNDWGWIKDDFGQPLPPTMNYIINTYFDNLMVYQKDGKYIIECDPFMMLRGTRIFMNEIMDYIIEGFEGEVEGYTLVQDIFEAIQNDIQRWYDIYLMGEVDEVEDEVKEEDEVEE